MSQNANEAADGSGEQTTIDGSVMIGSQEVHAVTSDDDREILGWIVPFTIGSDFVVPRDWLEQRASELNLSPRILPSEPSSKRAFTRAGNRVDDREVAEIEKNELVDLHLEKVRYERRYHLEVHDRREEGEFDGDVIGVIEYDAENAEPTVRPKVTPDDEMWRAWNEYVGEFRDEFDLMNSSNLGEDIRHMITQVFKGGFSRSVRFRAGGGVYFAPPALEDIVQALDTLVTDIDREFKRNGFPCELDTIEVASTQEKKSMVEEKVIRDLERQVNEIIDEAFEEIADDETLVDDIIADVESELDDVEDFASQYNALLDAEMTVEEHLEEWKQRASGEAEELIDEMLDAPADEDNEDDDDDGIGIESDVTQERVI